MRTRPFCGIFCFIFLGVLWPPEVFASEGFIYLALASSSKQLSCKQGTLSVRPRGADRAGRFELKIPANIIVPVTESVVDLSFEAENCWAETQTIVLQPGERKEARIDIWNTAVVKGLARTGGDLTLPAQIRVAFAPSFKLESAKDPKGEVTCLIGPKRSFRCRIPARKLDVRLSAPAFAPHYFWGLDLETQESIDLGAVPLVPGASLSGWLIPGDGGGLSPQQASLTIVPHGLSEPTNAKEERLRDTMILKGDLEENGFFQFRSVPPGEYVLKVQSQQYAEATVGVTVVEDSASEVRYPILLSPPMKAEFIIEPPVDYYQRNWEINIRRVDEFKSSFVEIDSGEVPVTGWFESKGVNPTTHLVTLSDSWGQQVYSEMMDFAAVPMPVVVKIGTVPVEGTVSLGEDPLEATIWFGGKNGATKVEFQSDEEGFYQGVLPRPGRWRVELEASTLPVKRKIANVEVGHWDGSEPVRVDLRLENTRIFGRVKNEDGSRPKSTTIVYAVMGTWDRHVSRRVDKEGSFEFLGLEEGMHQLHALSADSQSQPVAVNLREDEERSITLTLEKQQQVSGQVINEAGRPVPGALLVVQPADVPFLPTSKIRADGDGRFETTIPAKARIVDLTVSSPGRTLGVFRLPVNPDEPMTVTLPQEGGHLDVALGDQGLAGLARTGQSLVIFRGGVPVAEGEAMWWASIHRDERLDPKMSRVSFPRLVPGDYEVCIVPPSSYAQWLLGYRERDACDSGSLSYLGELELDVSSARESDRSE
jgi:hypothetical protein